MEGGRERDVLELGREISAVDKGLLQAVTESDERGREQVKLPVLKNK